MADTTVSSSVAASLQVRNGLWGPYWCDDQIGAIVYIDNNFDLAYERTTNGGTSWSKTNIDTATVMRVAATFDREVPGNTGDSVHIAWLDSGSNVCHYRSLDISADTLGTERTVKSSLTVSTTPPENRIAIGQSVSGNIMVALETASEIECERSTDGGSSWSSRADVFEAANSKDWARGFPAATSDDDDFAFMFLDKSASTLTVKMYDETADSWTETSVGTITINDNFPLWSGAVRHSDSAILFVMPTAITTAGNDLSTWEVIPGSIASPTVTAKTDLFTNDNSIFSSSVCVNQRNGDVYVGYVTGSLPASFDVEYKLSTDDMGTWGTANAYSEGTATNIYLMSGPPTVDSNGGRFQLSWWAATASTVNVNLVNDVGFAPVVGFPFQLYYAGAGSL